MNALLFLAAALALLLAAAHSYLGERYILIRLLRRTDLPRLFGGVEFTKQTLRFAWHLTSVAWCHRTLKPGQAGTFEKRPPRVGAVSIADEA